MQRFPVSAIRDAWYVYALDAGRFDIARRLIDTGHTTRAAYAADLSPTARAAYDNIIQRRDAAKTCHMPFSATQRPQNQRNA